MPSVTSVAYWAPKGWNELKVIVSCTFRDVQTAALFLSSAFRVPWEAEATFVTTPIDGCYITTHTHSHLWSGSELVNRSASLQARLLLCNKQTLCYFVKQTIHLCLPCKANYVRPYLRRWFENAKKQAGGLESVGVGLEMVCCTFYDCYHIMGHCTQSQWTSVLYNDALILLPCGPTVCVHVLGTSNHQLIST